MTQALLQIKGISKCFGGHTAVSKIDLDVGPGEILALLGPSGCGKTTLLRLIAGLETADEGSVLLDGVDITQLPPHRRPLNTIFQNYALFPHLSVRANIAFGPKLANWDRARIEAEVSHLLALMQLESHAHRRPDTLSGGQKQRVALARALILKPRVLLLDEPFAAMDLKLRQRMLFELQRLQRDVGISFVFVTHDQGEAMSISHRIAVMDRGSIHQIDTPARVYRHPHTRFVASFVGDANLWDGVLSRDAHGFPLFAAEAGFSVAIPADRRQDPPGSKVQATLCLRPEDLRLHPPDSEPAANRCTLRGKVRESVYQGSFSTFRVDCGFGQDWTVMQPEGKGNFHPQAGETVLLSWDVSRTIITNAAPPRCQPETAPDNQGKDMR